MIGIVVVSFVLISIYFSTDLCSNRLCLFLISNVTIQKPQNKNKKSIKPLLIQDYCVCVLRGRQMVFLEIWHHSRILNHFIRLFFLRSKRFIAMSHEALSYVIRRYTVSCIVKLLSTLTATLKTSSMSRLIRQTTTETIAHTASYGFVIVCFLFIFFRSETENVQVDSVVASISSLSSLIVVCSVVIYIQKRTNDCVGTYCMSIYR